VTRTEPDFGEQRRMVLIGHAEATTSQVCARCGLRAACWRLISPDALTDEHLCVYCVTLETSGS
jgi:transposase